MFRLQRLIGIEYSDYINASNIMVSCLICLCFISTIVVGGGVLEQGLFFIPGFDTFAFTASTRLINALKLLADNEKNYNQIKLWLGWTHKAYHKKSVNF